MKKIIALLLAILLCLPCAFSLAKEAGEAERETYTCGDFEYALLDDGTAEITSYMGAAETLEVPDELDGHAVTAIGDMAFVGRFGLTSITLPDSVTAIGSNPFTYCKNLTRIIVSPDHSALATIDGVLFSKMDKRLVCCPSAYTQPEYTVPQGIEIIGDKAFYRCSGLTSITLPDSVTAIGSNPFESCKNLIKIIVSPDHPVLATIDGVLFSKSDKRLVCCLPTYTQSEYTIPQGIEIVGDFAFSHCSGLTSITLPDNLTTIGNGTFSYCSGLTSIILPDSLAAIGGIAFSHCSSLTSITLSDNLTTIGNGAFYDCSSLTSITLPDSLTAIGYKAFSGCDNLTFTVGRDSYAKQYCIDNNLPYTYPDANDWLNG